MHRADVVRYLKEVARVSCLIRQTQELPLQSSLTLPYPCAATLLPSLSVQKWDGEMQLADGEMLPSGLQPTEEEMELTL